MSSTGISVARAAELLGLKYSQVLRRIKKGTLQAHKVEGGWGWIVDSKSAEELKQQCKNP